MLLYVPFLFISVLRMLFLAVSGAAESIGRDSKLNTCAEFAANTLGGIKSHSHDAHWTVPLLKHCLDLYKTYI